MKTKNMTTLHLRKSINRSPLRRGLLLIPLVLACLALPTASWALLPSPTPDGYYPGDNTAEGAQALYSLSYSGSGTNATANTAIGHAALYHNTYGYANTGVGNTALINNTTGYNNTAVGNTALYHNAIGFKNTATGHNALLSNGSGCYNTANGTGALKFNFSGLYNTADGYGALQANTIGLANTGVGAAALINNVSGQFNIAVGAAAGQNITGGNNIAIGSPGVAGQGSTLYIGNTSQFTDVAGYTHYPQTKAYIAGVYNVPLTGQPVVVSNVNGAGQLGVMSSSRRFKDNIKPMDKASDSVLSLKPVTFNYKSEIDPQATPQFGLIAEEVEKVNPDLVARDDQGKVYSVRYEAVNAMLLNEFLKEHQKVEQQEATITQVKTTAAKQEAIIAKQQKQIEALTTGLQKVSAQVEMSRPAPQMVNNNQ